MSPSELESVSADTFVHKSAVNFNQIFITQVNQCDKIKSYFDFGDLTIIFSVTAGIHPSNLSRK